MTQEKVNAFRVWVDAARLRTLPLASSAVILGGGLAALEGPFHWGVFLLSVLTGVLLQILANFANDYGDAVNGADGANRVGPKRAVSSGEISRKAMRAALVALSLVSMASGLALLTVSLDADLVMWVVFLILGGGAIAASVFYTVGKRPYGYRGLGDFFVFLFFGLVAVAGSYALYGAPLFSLPWLPACATGLFITAVLNINNIRDMSNDFASGKETLALRLGPRNARVYHLLLVGLGVACWLIWLLSAGYGRFLWLMLAAVPLGQSAWRVYGSLRTDVLDGQLRIFSLSVGFYNILLAVALPLMV
ncbi:MAG: 1,4-dihydroxy-2-naphthoate octaprenyltransferase [Zoogloeaceae bacterium]|jgi:1,4-dihydroxy-2-naphthoate octaprenyltransferase|nr:1,4-dihydroxy-2-naphthoate octaprenyltransferase [Zoogloeaceae bacterium]